MTLRRDGKAKKLPLSSAAEASRAHGAWVCTICLQLAGLHDLALQTCCGVRRGATTGAVVVHDVRPGLERAAQDADAANSSLGTAAAMESSDGVDMVSTFFTAAVLRSIKS